MQRLVIGLALGSLLFLSYLVLRPFLAPLAWAVILAYITWPLYGWLKRLMRGRATLSALTMTLFLTAAFVLPLIGWVPSCRLSSPRRTTR